jgi:hypothetical protein
MPGVQRKVSLVPSDAPRQDRSFNPFETASDYAQKDEHAATGNHVGKEKGETERADVPERKDQRENGETHKTVSNETEAVAEHNTFSGLCLNTGATDRLIQPYNALGVVSNFAAPSGDRRGGSGIRDAENNLFFRGRLKHDDQSPIGDAPSCIDLAAPSVEQDLTLAASMP